MDDLRINDAITIPAGEIEERFSTSGGPGGQHANRSATRVVLSFDVASSDAYGEDVRSRLLVALEPRMRAGVVTVTVDESRSQWRNRQLARQRLAEALTGAMRTTRPRIATKPSRASHRRRLDAKTARGRTKRLRRRPDVD